MSTCSGIAFFGGVPTLSLSDSSSLNSNPSLFGENLLVVMLGVFSVTGVKCGMALVDIIRGGRVGGDTLPRFSGRFKFISVRVKRGNQANFEG